MTPCEVYLHLDLYSLTEASCTFYSEYSDNSKCNVFNLLLDKILLLFAVMLSHYYSLHPVLTQNCNGEHSDEQFQTFTTVIATTK